MEDIRKKMESLRSETQNALNRAAQFEMEAKEANAQADKTEDLVINKKMFQNISYHDMSAITLG